MRPEREAELRAVANDPDRSAFADETDWSDLLDEIDRLQGLVREAHQVRYEEDGGEVWCRGCAWNHDNAPCDRHMLTGAQEHCADCAWWPMGHPDDSADEGDCERLHAAHVEALLRGDA